MRVPALLVCTAVVTVAVTAAAQTPVALPGYRGSVSAPGDPFVLDNDGERGLVTITFEGIDDGKVVGTIRNATFSPVWRALVDSDVGGSGAIANEPSGDTGAYVDQAPSNPAATRITFARPVPSVRFYYSQNTDVAIPTVSYYDPCDRLITTRELNVCGSTQCGASCSGDPTGLYCSWQSIFVADSSGYGIAAVEFSTNVRWFTVIDNLIYDDSFNDSVVFCDGFESGDSLAWTYTVGN